MAAPAEIIASIESILAIYLSGIRHRDRAAFILCDNLVEMSCKTRARQYDHTFNALCNFHNAWNANGVSIEPDGLGQRINDTHNIRNSMQHENAAITVERERLSDAILDAVAVIDHCWPRTSSTQFSDWIICALRIVTLFSSQGDRNKRQPFEDLMRNYEWRGTGIERLKKNESPIEPGLKTFWYIAVEQHTPLVIECLNSLEID